ncbi:MAG: glycerol-3-phosphate 1-O-acyltransferase PlsY [Gemmatimonadales bacterium]
MTGRVIVAAAGCYLLGSIPTSWLVLKALRGQDLRTTGSGNVGATNLYRVLGWRIAVPVGLFDALKGALPVAVIGPWAELGVVGSLGLGIAAVVGHVFPVFLGFKGGKGVATSAGVVLGLAPAAFAAALGVWGLVLTVSGYVSLASIAAAVALPVAVWLIQPVRRDMVIWFALLALAIVWLHRGNIRRLWNGTELRFGHHRPTVAGDGHE